ncbi:MAG: hypothetical protein ACRYFZ_19585 [Janthinobacterium lividum]
MYLNTAPAAPPRLPNIVELNQLTSPTGLLSKFIVPLMSLKQLKRRIREINATHPHYQEETPLVLAWEQQRRQRLSGRLHASVTQVQVA